MPDDAPPPKPIDLELPLDLGPAEPPPEELPEAVPVVARATRYARSERQPWAAPAQARRAEPPAKKRTLLAMVVVLGLLAATLAAVLVLMAAIYAGFKTFGKPGPATQSQQTKRVR